jgi:hypothetical protein
MANTNDARVRVTGGFSPGTRVGLAARYGDIAPKRLSAEQTATVDKDATVTFTGLPEGDRFWVFSLADDDRRALAATAKTETASKKRLPDSEVRNRLAQTTGPNRLQQGNTVLNPETKTRTVVLMAGGLEAQNDRVGKETPREDREFEPQPRLRQEDARNVPQRSATITGGAYPVEAGEPQPGPRQEDFQDVPQRSATPQGEATPILVKPDTQEDARRLHQRSATEQGEAVPKPEGDPVHQALTRDASVKRAATEQRDEPEPAGRAGDQRKKTPAPSKVRKASSKQSETAQAQKRDAGQRRAIRKQADQQSDN